jgi:hypothetical protein
MLAHAYVGQYQLPDGSLFTIAGEDDKLIMILGRDRFELFPQSETEFELFFLEGPGAQFSDVAIFNFSAIVGLMLGIKEKRLANGNQLTFGDGFMTGLGLAITYAVLTSLYFVFLLAVVGPKLMQQEGETSYVKAFAGLLIGFALFGAIFSAVIALVLRK